MKLFHFLKPPSRERSDEELMAEYRKTSNTQLVLDLMERHRAQILLFGLKQFRNSEDVKDFTNDVFVKLSEELSKREIANFRAWLKVFLRNLFHDKVRKESVRAHYLSTLVNDADRSFEHRVIREMDRHLLYRAMEGLSGNEQKCLQLLYLEEYSYEEVGEQTGWTFNQIRGLRDRAFRKLRHELTPELSSTV